MDKKWRDSEIAMVLSSIQIDLERELFQAFVDSNELMKDIPASDFQKDGVIKKALSLALKRAYPDREIKFV